MFTSYHEKIVTSKCIGTNKVKRLRNSSKVGQFLTNHPTEVMFKYNFQVQRDTSVGKVGQYFIHETHHSCEKKSVSLSEIASIPPIC